MTAAIQHFRHEPSGTFTYVVRDPDSRQCAIIDPVLDYDHAAGRTTTKFADRVADFVTAEDLLVEWILETHAHADHLSAAPYLKDRLGGPIAIGAGICKVQERFRSIFNIKDLNVTGVQFDHLFKDGDNFRIGNLEVEVMSTPGHTSDCLSYKVGDAVFVGDTLFAPDKGTARADFPGGSARDLFHSTRRLLSLPDETRIYLCHDYPGKQREAEHVHTVADHRARNVHVRDGVSEAEYVAKREKRDRGLSMPALIIPSVQVNIRAGRFPDPESNGVAYLKVPINLLGKDG